MKATSWAAVEELNWKEQESATGRYRELPKIAIKVPEISHLTKIELRVKGKFLSDHFFGSGRVIIGRSPDNEIDVESPFVSRRHAQITSDKMGSTIEDLNSTNDIFINDKRVKKTSACMTAMLWQLVFTNWCIPTFARPAKMMERNPR